MLEHEHVRLVRSPLPDDGEEHGVTGVIVYLPTDHFAIGFQTESGRTLRVRMHSDQLAVLGKDAHRPGGGATLAGDV